MANAAKGVAWHLGMVPYLSAWKLQQLLHKARVERDVSRPLLPHSLLILEHAPVYTLGRGASLEHLRFKPDSEPGVELYRVERGGQVTYHGPGQCTAYPVCDLRDPCLKQDLHWYVTGIEETIIRCLQSYGVTAERLKGKPGVWVHEPGASVASRGRLPWRKIAAVGMACSKWVTYHGLAVNVGPGLDMDAWQRIVPCGIGDEDKGVTSLRLELQYQGRLDEAEALVAPGPAGTATTPDRPGQPATQSAQASQPASRAPSSTVSPGMVDFNMRLARHWSEVFNMELDHVQGWPADGDIGLQQAPVGTEGQEEDAAALGHMKLPQALR